MNTQTHLLLACAVLLPATVNRRHSQRFLPRCLVPIVLAGALVPDASIFVMWGIAKIQAVPESVIWQEWYYSPVWQGLGAMTNSIPVFLLLLVLGWVVGGQFANATPSFARNQKNNFSAPIKALGTALVAFAGAALLHVLTDLPLHHDDGHPHFWPVSNWIFSSPVSYWDPAHYGRIWSIIEIVIAAVLIAVLWKRFHNFITRVTLIVLAFSYLIVSGYWVLVLS